MRKILLASTAIIISAGLNSPVWAQDASSSADKAAALTAGITEVVVTGSRVSHTVQDAPAPITVITPEALASTGATDIEQALTFSIPSFSTQSYASQDVASQVRTITLRALQPDQVLVLVNGVRRHNSALVNVSATIGAGSEPVDLDMIPESMIDHVEVLSDGAAAQYGSDAIAGVVNIILKSNDHGGMVSARGGAYYHKTDGINGQGLGETGIKLGESGFLNLSADVRSQGEANMDQDYTAAQANNGPVPAACPYFPASNPKCSPVFFKVGKGASLGKEQAYKFGYNLDYPVSADMDVYSFMTFAHRVSVGTENYRAPSATNDPGSALIGSLFPNGYIPMLTIDELDMQTVAGIKGPSFLGWSWNLSSSFGIDIANLHIDNTLNPTETVFNGANNAIVSNGPTNFHSGNFIYSQWTNNLEFDKALDTNILPAPLHTSVGFEYRLEEYQIQAGDPAGYAQGPTSLDPVGVGNNNATATLLAPGTQGFGTFRPGDASDNTRDNVSAYVDFETNLTPQWLIGIAGRFEDYSDFGSTESGKFTTRYDFTKEIGIRGTVSNGFRAPSLGQSNYSTTTTNFFNQGGQNIPLTIRQLPVDSPAAIALGAQPLKAETSMNYSAGVVYNPLKNLHATMDAYQIDIDNRIVQTPILGQGATAAPVAAILAAHGITGIGSAQFFENAIDTHLIGVDIATDYTTDFDEWGSVKWSANFNLHRQNITKIASQSSVITGLGINLFDRQAQGFITSAIPKSKLILGVDWFKDAYSVALHVTRYGSYTLPAIAANPVYYDVRSPPEKVVDLELGWDVTDSFHLAVGANNLFDLWPANQPWTSIYNAAAGTNPRIGDSPFGINGGQYYARIEYRW